jgi:hypothetical protein
MFIVAGTMAITSTHTPGSSLDAMVACGHLVEVGVGLVSPFCRPSLAARCAFSTDALRTPSASAHSRVQTPSHWYITRLGCLRDLRWEQHEIRGPLHRASARPSSPGLLPAITDSPRESRRNERDGNPPLACPARRLTAHSSHLSNPSVHRASLDNRRGRRSQLQDRTARLA